MEQTLTANDWPYLSRPNISPTKYLFYSPKTATKSAFFWDHFIPKFWKPWKIESISYNIECSLNSSHSRLFSSFKKSLSGPFVSMTASDWLMTLSLIGRQNLGIFFSLRGELFVFVILLLQFRYLERFNDGGWGGLDSGHSRDHSQCSLAPPFS